MIKPRDIDPEGFVGRFTRFGEVPTVERYVRLFTDDGTVQHPGMPRPLVGQRIRDFISGVLSAMPDFKLRPSGWGARDDIVFVEAQSAGSLGDRFASWPAIYRVQLRGDQVVRGRSFYDRADVFAQLERKESHNAAAPVGPATTPLVPKNAGGDVRIAEDVGRRYAEAWTRPNARHIAEIFDATGSGMAPGTSTLNPEALVHQREELFDTGTLRQTCLHCAAEPGSAYFQWELGGTIDGRPFTTAAAERIVLNGSKITASRIYFDTLAFEALRDPSVASRTIFDAAGGSGRAPLTNTKEGRHNALL